MMLVSIYIDANNLHRSAKSLGFNIDYKKFGVWLRQKYSPTEIYIFIGYVSAMNNLYEYLRDCGFVLIFKETAVLGGGMKGNCDTELVLKSVSDFYTKSCLSFILVSGDGDFGCLVKFLSKNGALSCVIIPDRNASSFLLRNQNIQMLFLNEHYYKFST